MMSHRLFISYSHADKQRLDRLHKHLAQLKREGQIEAWFDRDIAAGQKIDQEVATELNAADIFLAILSPDFIASNYCYDIELDRALARETQGTLTIIPIVFEPCDWLSTPLKKFKALPEDGKPVSEFSNENIALLSIVSELRQITSRAVKVPQGGADVPFPTPLKDRDGHQSRYRIKREFDRVDKRDFVNKAFAEIKRFFKESTQELALVPELDAEMVDLDHETFSCTVVNRGFGRAFETVTIRKGGSFGDIDLVYGENPARNTSNGGFYVDNDDYSFHLRSSMGYTRRVDTNLSPRDAAKQIWDDLLSKVGVDYA